MIYHVEFTKYALREIKKIDKATAFLITGWIRKNLEGCENPRIHGKGITADKTGQWRYRVGDYRIMAQIQDEKVTILVVNIGHRREIYKK